MTPDFVPAVWCRVCRRVNTNPDRHEHKPATNEVGK